MGLSGPLSQFEQLSESLLHSADGHDLGDTVTVERYLAKDGAKFATTRRVTLADGRTVDGGTQQ